MIITNHKLAKEFAVFDEIRKSNGNFSSGLPDTIVIHYTAGPGAESAINTFKETDVKASAHVVIDSDGKLTQLVPFHKIAWHAGKSAWLDRKGLNKYSIGIEIANAGRLDKSGNTWRSWFGKTYSEEDVVVAVHRNESEPSGWHRYTEEQISTVFELCRTLMKRYEIRYILGHEEISPGRKIDPGPAFPLGKLREHLLDADRKDDEEDPTDKNFIKGIVNAGSLNIRSGPGTGHEIIADPLSRNTDVAILVEKKGWYQVEVKMRGWVSKKFIQRVDR